MSGVWGFCGGAVASAWAVGAGVTWVMLVLSRRFRLLDLPNVRSAHLAPMPTGGGMGLISGCWAGWAWLLTHGGDGWLAGHAGWLTATGAGTLMLLPMIWDDLVRPLRVGEKMGLLLLAALVWVVLYGGAQPLVAASPWRWRMLIGGLVVCWFVSMSNASNFMDGIDGIVGVQVISVAGITALSLWVLGEDWQISLVLSAATSGFLLFNRPPARVFMGDVGSNAAGFLLAALGILAVDRGLPPWLYLAYNWVFVFDTGYTLVRRLGHRENLLQAHQKHLYQRLIRVGWSHGRVDLWVLMLNSILGVGGILYLSGNPVAGLCLLGTGVGFLAGEAVYVERRDLCFG